MNSLESPVTTDTPDSGRDGDGDRECQAVCHGGLQTTRARRVLDDGGTAREDEERCTEKLGDAREEVAVVARAAPNDLALCLGVLRELFTGW